MNPTPNPWHIQLLGSFAATVDGVGIEAGRWRLRKAKSLVAMLALAPAQRRHREHILERLWPDLEPTAAARNLHQTLYLARRALTGTGLPRPGLLTIRDQQVLLDEAGQVEVDVLQFELAARHALASGRVGELQAASDLYVGDLLPELIDVEWATGRREQLRQIHREISVKLATALQDSAPEQALMLLTRLLESNPVHEGAVRGQMEVLARMGRRSEALARYERLADDLLDTFGTDPDAQTAALFRQLLTGSPVLPQPRAEVIASTHGRSDGYLPTPVSSFIGRQRELVDVKRLAGQARLLTLTGTGGCGKTRLAIELARSLVPSYPDGVWFVDLAAVSESWQVGDAVAATLELDSDVAPDRVRALVEQLRHRQLLIVLDNCEHLLAACSRLVSVLLTECPRLGVLTTSREALHADGEFTFRVPSLALPEPVGDQAVDLDHVGRLSSVRLFVERAAQVRPGFALDVGNAHALIDLCRRLDGLPLALELAAARVGVLEPAEIVNRLDDGLSLLGGSAASFTRHQTLRATLEWSYGLLTEPEQVLVRRLSVFSGSFSIAAAEAVCGGPPLQPTGVFDLMANLVDKSLVLALPMATTTRFRLLETVRQFSSEKLDRAAESGRLATAHAAYFLDFAVAHNPERVVGVVIEQPKLLDGEHDNLRVALRWACAHDPDTALRLAASLWRFWLVRGHAVEGARWVERALAVAPEPTRPRAAALIGLTGLDSRQGRSDRHRSLGAEAMAIVTKIGAPEEVVMAQIVEATLAWSVFDLGDAERMAADIHAQGVARGRADHAAAGSWLLAHCALFREDGPLALRYLDTCLDELARSDDGMRPFLPVITPCLQLVPVAGRVVPIFEETMLLGRRVGVRQATGCALAAVGYAHRLSDDRPSAIASVAEAVDLFAGLDDDLAQAQALHQMGCIHRDSGDYQAAEQALTRARDLRIGLGDRRGELLTDINITLVDVLAGDVDRGVATAQRCLSRFESAGDLVGIAATLTVLGAIKLLSGENRAARELYRRAAEQFAAWPRFSGWLRLVIAELSFELADHRRAVRDVMAAEAIYGRTKCLIADRRLSALRARDTSGFNH